jgi:predicted DCC family thiol-disulfide oxidoreductase YuxK
MLNFKVNIIFMKVYFNNSCKICRSEINMYKKENIEDIDWIDITDNKEAEKETSKNDKELLRRLHVKENDQVIEGAEAFLYVWKRIPKYKFLYSFFKLPIIFTIFKYGYEIVAYFLYLKNKKQLKN